VASDVLTARQLNRALLARQLLLERSSSAIPTVLERMGGLQAQYAPATYIGLWSRVEAVERDAVTRLLETRQVIQGTLLRGTIHVVSKADYWPFALGIRAERRRWLLRTAPQDAAGMDRMAAKLREALAEGPMRQTEIDKLLGPRMRNHVPGWLDLIRVPPSGTWNRRRADLYALAESWVGSEAGTADAGLELLLRRYLTAFGPATRQQISQWAGTSITALKPVLDRLDLRTFRAEDGAQLVDLPGAPLPDPDTPAPVRLIAHWDASLLVHARRTGILPEQYRPRIFHVRAPHSFATFLVDGAVAGTWRHEGGRIVFDEFHAQPKSVRKQLEAEGERLAAFHA
jgi:hypothetical protein